MIERRAEAVRAFKAISGLTAKIRIQQDQTICEREVFYLSPSFWRVEDDQGLLLLNTPDTHVSRAEDGNLRLWRPRQLWVPDEEIGYLGWGHPEFLMGGALVDADPKPRPHQTTGRPIHAEVYDMQGKQCALETDIELGIVLTQSTDGTYTSTVIDLEVEPKFPADCFNTTSFSDLQIADQGDEEWASAVEEEEERTTFWFAP